MNDYQKFIATSRYAKWVDEEGRRETWEETVRRYLDNVVEPVIGASCPETETYPLYELEAAILNLDVMPSMRAVMTAGKALERDNTCAYNCSYLEVNHPRAFDEAMFISLCGTGAGFSVERQHVNKLPEVPEALKETDYVIEVADSKEGWAKAYRKLLQLLYVGEVPKWDTSRVRPAGERLKTFGGRSSGPAPLIDLFNFTINIFRDATGRKLSSIECHDLMCKIGEVVVVGGVRRSAMISLSNLSDNRMRHAKTGQWWENDPQRSIANNSVCYTEKPDSTSFMREWLALVESGSGERGIFNRGASKRQAAKSGRRKVNWDCPPKFDGVRDHSRDIPFGTNPCSEIILRPNQFCNLTEVVVRADDTIETLSEKVRLATILGTIQSTYTHFPYLRKIWQKNTEEERLLGVSLTGIMDNPLMTTKNKGLEKTLDHLRDVAISTNAEFADRLGIQRSTAITCVKPSGTVSQLVDSASGIHPRHSKHYIRTVRGDNADPLTSFLKDQGIPNEPEFHNPDKTTVFSFPMSAPKGAVVTSDLSAIEQLKTWLVYQDHWCEHKPSITVHVKDDEWMEVGAFVYKNFDQISGIAFLPYDGHTYQQAPYQEVSWKEVVELRKQSPKSIDWEALQNYEQEDNTTGSQSLACSADGCEIVDIT